LSTQQEVYAMEFDNDFFDELRGINQSDLGATIPDSIRPKVSELDSAGLVTKGFSVLLEKLTKKLYAKKKTLTFNADFIVYPRHICTFPYGLAFRRQLNVGFYAGDTHEDDCIRFGLGFPINKNFSQKGVDEYTDFLVKVVSAPQSFDEFFDKVGSYAEPDEMSVVSPMSLSIRQHTPDFEDDWRFFGRLLTYRNDADIICNMDNLVVEMVRIFDLISTCRY